MATAAEASPRTTHVLMATTIGSGADVVNEGVPEDFRENQRFIEDTAEIARSQSVGDG
jgi:hypothetical protein